GTSATRRPPRPASSSPTPPPVDRPGPAGPAPGVRTGPVPATSLAWCAPLGPDSTGSASPVPRELPAWPGGDGPCPVPRASRIETGTTDRPYVTGRPGFPDGSHSTDRPDFRIQGPSGEVIFGGRLPRHGGLP